MKKLSSVVLALLLLFMLCACGSGKSAGPAPVLDGNWVQVGKGDRYYQKARIEGNRIQTYWYLVEDDKRLLYWTGSFENPEYKHNSYVWHSATNLQNPDNHPWCMRDESMEFTYKDGKLIYNVRTGRINLGVSLEREN